ncbi:hypothetical protein BD779DRAFT_1563605 [Infundibulicybe gibba]|nr:hypothetical protein BD779DRAFT_1563605 [Infundibulicybe gibba]
MSDEHDASPLECGEANLKRANILLIITNRLQGLLLELSFLPPMHENRPLTYTRAPRLQTSKPWMAFHSTTSTISRNNGSSCSCSPLIMYKSRPVAPSIPKNSLPPIWVPTRFVSPSIEVFSRRLIEDGHESNSSYRL